jgi:DNA-binding beta-propeller fold protein YncE
MTRTMLALLALSVAFPQSGYHQLRKIAIGGEGGWDYSIADGHGRVFVSHAAEVVVVDTKKGEVAGKIAGLKGVHGIALAPEFNRGYISNGQGNNITVFDLKTLDKIGAEIPAGTNPDAIMYDPVSKRVFAFNGRSANATAIDAKSGKVDGTIALGGRPEFAQTDGKGHVFVNLENKSSVSEINSKTLAVEHTWPLAPCEGPSGMAMDTKTRRIFSGCEKMMSVLDADSGKVVTTLPICTGVDATAFDPETKYIFNSCGDGTLTVIHEDSPDKYTKVEDVKTQRGSRTMALDESTHRVYLAAAEFEAAPAGGRGRPNIVAGTFYQLEFGR